MAKRIPVLGPGLILLVGFCGVGCATQKQTGQALTVAGIAAVVVAAAAVDDGPCFEREGHTGPVSEDLCRRHPSKAEQRTAAAIAAGGMGLALIGQALQHEGPDTTRPVRSVSPPQQPGEPLSAEQETELTPGTGDSASAADCRGEDAEVKHGAEPAGDEACCRRSDSETKSKPAPKPQGDGAPRTWGSGT